MEREFIHWLRERLPAHPLLRLGLGDDAAVLDMTDSPQCAVTVDMLTDGVDFVLSEIDARRAGRKALAANLSDLAAMAARPTAGVVALCLPRKNGLQLAVELYEGMLPLAEKYDLIIAGGDTNSWDGPAAISITLLGAVTEHGPLRRGGARPGDRIIVTGSFGGSILGRHLDFEPRVFEALKLNADYRLRAGMDVSDGLSLDLARMAEENGVGAALELDRIPIADDARRLAERLDEGSTALDHALSDGEDFELILAVEPDEARRLLADQPLDVPLTDIGEFVTELGLWRIDIGGARTALAVQGWEHELK